MLICAQLNESPVNTEVNSLWQQCEDLQVHLFTQFSERDYLPRLCLCVCVWRLGLEKMIEREPASKREREREREKEREHMGFCQIFMASSCFVLILTMGNIYIAWGQPFIPCKTHTIITSLSVLRQSPPTPLSESALLCNLIPDFPKANKKTLNRYKKNIQK